MTPTLAPASWASIAARIPAQPAPTTRTSCVASTGMEASGTDVSDGRGAATSPGPRLPTARGQGRRQPRPARASRAWDSAASRSQAAVFGGSYPGARVADVVVDVEALEVGDEHRSQLACFAVVPVGVGPGGARVEQ